MDMTQIAMQLRTQMLQQNGVGEGQSGQISESGTSFADLIMNMLSNSQGNVQSSGLLNNIANLQQENQADSILQNGAPDSGFIDIESFASEYGGVLNTLAQEILESRSDSDTLDFSLLQKNFAMTEKNEDDPLINTPVQEQAQPEQAQPEQTKSEVKADEPIFRQPTEMPVQSLMPESPKGEVKAEEPVLSQPSEKLVQNAAMPEQTQSEQPVLNQPTEKPVQILTSEQTQSEQPKGEVKAEEPVLNQPTDKPLQSLFIPNQANGEVKPEQAKPEQTQSEQPKGEVKAEESVLSQPTEKPLQNLFVPNQSDAEIRAEKPVQILNPQGEVEAEPVNQPTEKPLQNLFVPNQPDAEIRAEKPVQILNPQGEVKAEPLNQPTEKPLQNLFVPNQPDAEITAEMPVQTQGEVKAETVLNQPTEKPLQNLFVPNQPKGEVKAEQTQSEQPVLRQPTEKPLQNLFVPNQPNGEVKAEQSTEMPVQPEKTVQALMPEQPKGEIKAEQHVSENNEPVFEYSFGDPIQESFETAAPYEPKKLDIPLNKRNIDTLMRAGILQKSKANNKAEGSGENEQNYYPVTTDNKQLSYDDVIQMTNLFAMPALKSDNSKNEVRLSDFSDSVIKADPMQLSGLLDMVTTGSSIPVNNDVLGSLYKEASAISGISDIVSNPEKNMAAFDFVSKYIESGEVEIVGYKPEDIIKQFSEQQLRQEQNVQETDKPIQPETVQGEKSDRAVSNNNDMLNVYRSMRTAKETMSLARKSEKTEPVEFETLQNNVSRLDIRFDKIDSEMKMNQTFEAPEKQIAKGVEENLKQGRNEFTVKLKPEGLGEIIVKLVKNDGGKMLMSMTASNVRTAQLLNKNISELQSSLSQQNVEIINPKDMTKTVMPMTPAFEQYYSHQNGGGQQQQQQQQFNNRNYGYRTYSDVDDDEAFESKAKSPVENDGLNIMI